MNLKHFNYSVLKVTQTLSTNDLLWDMLQIKQQENGFTIIAESQTKGKGQKGNVWVSVPGKNLTASIFVSPKISSQKVFYLNIMASLAVCKTLAQYQIESSIKWPNDIIVNQHKIAGLLIENQIQGQSINKTVIGLGLNINQISFPIDRAITSIALETGNSSDIESFLKKFLFNLDFYFDLLLNQHFNILKKQYLKKLHLIDTWSEFSSPEVGQFTGSIKGITEEGKLRVKNFEGIENTFDMQTIRFL